MTCALCARVWLYKGRPKSQGVGHESKRCHIFTHTDGSLMGRVFSSVYMSVCLLVCLSVCFSHNFLKTDAARITKLDTVMVRLFWGQKVKSQGHKAQRTVPAWVIVLLQVLASSSAQNNVMTFLILIENLMLSYNKRILRLGRHFAKLQEYSDTLWLIGQFLGFFWHPVIILW